MSKDDFEYHAHAAGASSNMVTESSPVVDGVVVPADIAAVFSETACAFAVRLIRMALDEDGPDLTSIGIFPPKEEASAYIVAKQRTLVAGLPLVSLVLAVAGMQPDAWHAEVKDGDIVECGTVVAHLHGRTVQLLKAERIILNLMTHLSGVANLTREYVLRLEGTGVRLLDTRKTLPGQRYLEKYAVRVAGGYNHRMNLGDMLMIKDNHIDAAGSIAGAVKALRKCYTPCPPIEVECRNKAEVLEAVQCCPERILLDNMDALQLAEVLPLIPRTIEAEISGGVTLENIRRLALACRTRPADFISVGRITHSAPSSDFSMKMERCVGANPSGHN